MKIKTYILRSGFTKAPLFQSAVHRSCIVAIKRIQRILNIQRNIDIVCYVNPQSTIPEIGIGGFTPNAHTIFISLDPNHKYFRHALRNALPRTLAHELHHAVRWLKPGYGQTLGEALVTEGLAAHFELEVFGGKPNAWDISVRGKKLNRLLTRSRPEWHTPYNHNAWFFGSKERNIPRWTGYALGYNLVDQALKANPSWKPSALVNVPVSRIIPDPKSRS